MNTSRSLDASCSTAFKALQFQFMNWAADWTNAGNTMEQHSIDLPDLVQLLRALGFNIRRMDGCSPEETCPLKGNEKGIRVIVTCNHSGHRYYLEQPLDEDMCKCTKVSNNDSQDGVWEIVATEPSLNQSASIDETGSGLIAPLSKELKQIIYSVINYLVHMIYGSVELKPDSAAVPVPAEKEDVSKLYSDQYYSIQRPAERTIVKAASSMYDVTKNPTVVSSPVTGTVSPTRHRSLDTLTSKGTDSGFPEPASLSVLLYSISESETSALSGSSINLTKDDLDGDESIIEEIQTSEIILQLMKSAIKDIQKAILLMAETKMNLNDSSDTDFEKHFKSNMKSAKNQILLANSEDNLRRAIHKLYKTSKNMT